MLEISQILELNRISLCICATFSSSFVEQHLSYFALLLWIERPCTWQNKYLCNRRCSHWAYGRFVTAFENPLLNYIWKQVPFIMLPVFSQQRIIIQSSKQVYKALNFHYYFSKGDCLYNSNNRNYNLNFQKLRPFASCLIQETLHTCAFSLARQWIPFWRFSCHYNNYYFNSYCTFCHVYIFLSFGYYNKSVSRTDSYTCWWFLN